VREYPRYLNLVEQSRSRSVFLFGPRQTGKTFLLRKTFPASPYYNLLHSDQFLRLSARPSILREELLASAPSASTPVIIDEVQKLPILLDEVQDLIEAQGLRFILSGSSARKLVRQGANLLGGRARTRYLFPLTSAEIGDIDLERALNFGTLPAIYQSDEPEEDLLAYCGTYLQEEVQAEDMVRRIENFSRFLRTAALMNAELVSYENAASDAGVPARTVREYFGILQDTLVGFLVNPFSRTSRRKAVSRAKFYFFDVGVGNVLAGRSGIRLGTELFGKCFEHFIATEIRACLHYRADRRELTFWRSTSGFEVDFVIGGETAVEVKGTAAVSEKHVKGLRALNEEIALRNSIVVSMDDRMRKVGDILVLPWQAFLSRLWAGEL
jgi:predicted AAA+ superfamily ATPase